jgi:hypothetical protein
MLLAAFVLRDGRTHGTSRSASMVQHEMQRWCSAVHYAELSFATPQSSPFPSLLLTSAGQNTPR